MVKVILIFILYGHNNCPWTLYGLQPRSEGPAVDHSSSFSEFLVAMSAKDEKHIVVMHTTSVCIAREQADDNSIVTGPTLVHAIKFNSGSQRGPCLNRCKALRPRPLTMLSKCLRKMLAVHTQCYHQCMQISFIVDHSDDLAFNNDAMPFDHIQRCFKCLRKMLVKAYSTEALTALHVDHLQHYRQCLQKMLAVDDSDDLAIRCANMRIVKGPTIHRLYSRGSS